MKTKIPPFLLILFILPMENFAQQPNTSSSIEKKITQISWARTQGEETHHYAFLQKEDEIKGIVQLIKDHKIVTDRMVAVQVLDNEEKKQLLANTHFEDVIKIEDEIYYYGKDTEGPQEATYFLVTNSDASPDYKVLTALNSWFIYDTHQGESQKLTRDEAINKAKKEWQEVVQGSQNLQNQDFMKLFDAAQKHDTGEPVIKIRFEGTYHVGRTPCQPLPGGVRRWAMTYGFSIDKVLEGPIKTSYIEIEENKSYTHGQTYSVTLLLSEVRFQALQLDNKDTLLTPLDEVIKKEEIIETKKR